MPVKISNEDEAVEGSSYTIETTFTDEDDAELTPNTFNWSETDEEGTVINGHSAETETPSSTVAVTLKGDDLAMQTGESEYGYRVYTVWGTYNSTYGTDLPYQESCRFRVRNLIAK